jgi:hypothetical protein
VSWYGVARPCADSGFAGTMMSQLTLAAAVAAAAVVVALALAHGVAEAEAVAVAVLVPVAAVVGVAVPDAAVVADAVPVVVVVGATVLEAAVVGAAVVGAATVGAAVVGAAVVGAAVVGAAVVAEAVSAAAVADAELPGWLWLRPPALAGFAGTTYADSAAQLAFAASVTFVLELWLMATTAPTTTASPTGIAIGTANRASELRDRRPADRCLLGMQSTSMS